MPSNKENIVFVVFSTYDHSGGGATAVFTDLEKARQFIKDDDDGDGSWLAWVPFDTESGNDVRWKFEPWVREYAPKLLQKSLGKKKR